MMFRARKALKKVLAIFKVAVMMRGARERTFPISTVRFPLMYEHKFRVDLQHHTATPLDLFRVAVAPAG